MSESNGRKTLGYVVGIVVSVSAIVSTVSFLVSLDRRVTVVETTQNALIPIFRSVETEQRERSRILGDLVSGQQALSKRLDRIESQLDSALRNR